MRKLYGGAIVADVPARFLDISMFREVPDNQEVYADVNTDESVIVELLELDDKVSNDNAPMVFMADVAKANDCDINNTEECRIIERVSLSLDNMKSFGVQEGTLLVCCQNVAKFKENVRNAVAVYMVSIRIPMFSTDLLISVNAPISISAGSSSSFSTVQLPSQQEARDLVVSIAKSLKIVDRSLFG